MNINCRRISVSAVKRLIIQKGTWHAYLKYSKLFVGKFSLSFICPRYIRRHAVLIGDYYLTRGVGWVKYSAQLIFDLFSLRKGFSYWNDLQNVGDFLRYVTDHFASCTRLISHHFRSRLPSTQSSTSGRLWSGSESSEGSLDRNAVRSLGSHLKSNDDERWGAFSHACYHFESCFCWTMFFRELEIFQNNGWSWASFQ